MRFLGRCASRYRTWSPSGLVTRKLSPRDAQVLQGIQDLEEGHKNRRWILRPPPVRVGANHHVQPPQMSLLADKLRKYSNVVDRVVDTPYLK